jgi:hypothetical protein
MAAKTIGLFIVHLSLMVERVSKVEIVGKTTPDHWHQHLRSNLVSR